MDSNELRALADALDGITPVMGLEELHHMETLDRAADFLRQCADEKPVAWRVEVRWTDTSRDRGRWRKYADYATEKSALSSSQRFANPGDIESRTVPLYLHPAPAAPQAEPPRQAGQEISLGALMREQRQSRIVAGAFPDGNPAAKAMIAQTPQAEPQREPLSDDQMRAIERDADLQYIQNGRLVPWPIVFARMIERAHGIGEQR